MKIVKDKIEIAELKEMSGKMFGGLVKAMVDVEKEIMAVDAPMHSDLLESLMEEENSEPVNLWGINIYPEKDGEDFIEFDSMMNLKPGLGNKSRGVENVETREKIIKIVVNLVKK
jgi:hypothetical protein